MTTNPPLAEIRLRPLRLFAVYLCLVAAWCQFLLPVAAQAQPAFDPSAIICASRSGSDPGPAPAHDHAHHHCLACFFHALTGPLTEAPAHAVPRPAIALVAWTPPTVVPLLKRQDRHKPPRGPPATP